MAEPLPLARAPIAPLTAPLGREAPLSLRLRDVSLASVHARDAAAAARAAAAWGLAWPEAGRMTGNDAHALISIGPGACLAVKQGADPQWPRDLAAALRGAAAVCDQSGGYVVLRIAGDYARALLSKGVFIDLHPGMFTRGSAAATCARIPIVLWRPGGACAYDVAAPRSYAHSFMEWAVFSAAALDAAP